ncbi:MAG: citrate/2-methylcitrate synthase [Thermoguttaceae bacterium]|jgi:citrate synthase|nr:citrate/2-methylcitrate synthase [Thermoguttaceae bacterium]
MVEPAKKEPFHWQSAISYKTRERIVIRGYDVNELTGNISFAEMLHLVWKGELPQPNVAKMIDALLVCFAEHAMSPSSASARMVMSGAGYIMPALAGGVLSIGYTHVDAHEAAATWIAAVDLMKEKNWTMEEAADFLAQGIRNKDKDDAFVRRFGDRKVIPGWHHPQHLRDLRSPRIIEVAERLGVAGDHVKFIVALENATEKYWGRRVYMNVAGAISATLVDMGFNPDECLAFCAIARSVSVTAHCVEEKTREKGWRASSRSTITQPLDLSLQKPDYYDGPADRSLPAERIVQPLARAPYHYVE